MTVIKRYRSVAKLEFFTNAQRLRRNIFLLTARDFGIKKTVRTVEMLTEGMTDEDKTALKALAEKYGLARFNAEYPEWILEKFRNSLWDLTRDLLMNLTQANSIYALNTYEAQERRLLQDKAIGNCEQILKEFEFIIDVFPVISKKYMPYVDIIEREITLIKGWRKSDNKRLNNLTK